MASTKRTPKRKPTNRRADKWQPIFLKALADTGNVRASCMAANIGRTTAYIYKDQHEAFAKAWDTAIEDACDILEAVAWKRAKELSDVLLIFLLKAHRPAKYRDTVAHDHGGTIQLEVVYATNRNGHEVQGAPTPAALSANGHKAITSET